MHTLVRITTVPVSLQFLLKGQLKFMKQNGFNVIAASAGGKEVEAVTKYEECKHFSFPLTRSINPIVDIVCLVKLFFFFKKIKPTIVHSHTPKAGLLAMISAKLANVPIRLHTIAGLPWMESKGFKKSILRNVEKLTIYSSTKTYVNSNNLLLFLRNENFKTNKLSILGNGTSNGIDEKYFLINEDIKLKTQQLLKENNVEPSVFIWLFVGRIVKDKGIQELVDAFEEIKKQFPQDQLWLVGNEEPQLDPLDKIYIDKISNNYSIKKFGFQNDVRPFYVASNILVFPSYREGFPNVPMQAALLNCGLILSNINGCNEIVEHKKNGLLVEVKDKNDLFTKMFYARKNQKNIDEFKINAKDFVLKNYSQRTVWNNVLKEYNSLVKEYVL